MATATQREALEREVADLLRHRFPTVQLYDVELRGGRQSAVTVFIDRPDGVDVETCAAVSAALEDLRERHSLEVSSPGLERRLRRPEHFARVVGKAVTLRTVAPREGRSGYRGTVSDCDERGMTLSLDEGGELRVDYADIARANLVYRFESNGGHRE